MSLSPVSGVTSAPWSSVVFIQATFPSGASFGGSGVMVGPNDVLTASHLLYMASQGGAATSVTVTPGFDADPYVKPYGDITTNSFHYYANYDSGGGYISPGNGGSGLAGAELDIALIDLPVAVGNQSGWMQIDPNFSSGSVNITGYPAASGWNMMNETTSAYADRVDSTIGYSATGLSPGSSGSPVWYSAGDGGHVVGVVSTGAYGANVKGTYNDLMSWISGNDGMITQQQPVQQQPAPTVTTTPTTTDTQTQTQTQTQTPAPTTDTTTQQPPAPTSGTVTQTSADFNGDGSVDSLVRNMQTGITEIVNTDGSHQATAYQAGLDWQVIGNGDFNGDGRGDILWQHNGGLTAIWTMNGSYVIDGAAVQQTPSGARLANTNDVNGDGRSDITWQGSDGHYTQWIMNDHSVTASNTLSAPVSAPAIDAPAIDPHALSAAMLGSDWVHA